MLFRSVSGAPLGGLPDVHQDGAGVEQGCRAIHSHSSGQGVGVAAQEAVEEVWHGIPFVGYLQDTPGGIREARVGP